MIGTIVRAFALGCVISGGIGTGAEPDKKKEMEQAAVAAAEAWVALVDEGKYAESWTEAAESFKGAIKQEPWEQALQGVRRPLGKLVSRKVKSTVRKTDLPGAPDGEYVIVEFETVFENKKAAVETITPKLEKDGKWKVSGYFIR